MRILTVVEDLLQGGTQRNAQNMALAHRDAGHESAVLAYRDGGPREEPLRRGNITLFIGAGGRTDAAIEAAAAWSPRVIHIHRTGGTDPVVADLIRRLKSRIAGRTAVVETNVFARVDYSPDGALFDVHTQIARWCLWKWSTWARVVRPRPIGVLVPYLVHADAFYPAPEADRLAFRAARGIPADALVFGRAGSPIDAKWHPIIFDAFEAFASERADAYLLLVGAPNDFDGRIAAMPGAIRRRVVKSPLIHGDENLRACYAAMDVFLHAARIGESFGMVLCESMLCGVPVVTLSTPAKDNAQLEVVGHERGGLIVTDARSMTAGMRRLAGDPALRHRLAEQGAAWVRAQYGPQTVGPLLNRVVTLAAECPSRGDLRAALEADPALTTSISDDEIRMLLSRSMGSVSLRDRVLMRLVMQPRIYQWYYGYKRRRIAAQVARGRAGV
jgi:glycosyltransferase involved in cell wall biosynthesis